MIAKLRGPGLPRTWWHTSAWRTSALAASMSALMPAVIPAMASASESYAGDALAEMSIEELGNIQVTSVSKRAEPLSAAPASIYVITNDDIHRLGATTLPEALRLAPNLEVVQFDALSYSISARGFNSTEAGNKLLVLVDGRSVYSPLHSGVFWDAQDVMMEDIDRIEVVGGPGGTLWGANAVNGVINIITKSAAETAGGLVNVDYGITGQTYGARYGFAPNENFAYRGYVKASSFSHSRNPNGTNHIDDWDKVQGGFRADWKSENNKATVQGDFYDGGLEIIPSTVSGQNITGNWTHDFAGSGPLQLLVYYDNTHRNQPGVIQETVKTYNAELQHSFNIGTHQQIVWGGGYRRTEDSYNPVFPFGIVRKQAALKLASIFVQDEITLAPTLKATAGVKVEHHTYTGFEYMPNVRLAWQPIDQHLLWASVSRAVRTPARLDREFVIPPILIATPDFASETLIAYEVGYRGQFFDRLTFSLSGYYNDYDKLRTTNLVSLSPLVVQLRNDMRGHTYGLEAWGQFKVTEWWRLSAGVTGLHKDLTVRPGIVDFSNRQAAGNDPDYQVQVRSFVSPVQNVDIDVGLRAIDSLPAPATRSYVEMDARVGWHVTNALELSVAGFNLLHDQHEEGGAIANRHALRRTVQGSLRWNF